MVTLELLFSLFVRCSRSAGTAALNQGAGFRSCVAFRSKGVNVSPTPSVHSHLLCRVSRFTTPLSCIPLSSLLQIFRYFAADPACCSCIFCNSRPFGHQKSRFPKKATLLLRLLDGRRIHHHVNLRWYREPFPTSIVYKRESAKRRLPSCKTGTLAGVALSCVSFDPMGAWLLRNLPPQSAYFYSIPLLRRAHCLAVWLNLCSVLKRKRKRDKFSTKRRRNNLEF